MRRHEDAKGNSRTIGHIKRMFPLDVINDIWQLTAFRGLFYFTMEVQEIAKAIRLVDF